MAQTLSSLPIGAKIKFGKHQVGTETVQPIIWALADKNHAGYPSNSVTLVTEKIIDLRGYDGAETGATTGNNNYALSNINQWLNSSASAGNWYVAKHTKDAPPSAANIYYGGAYDTRPGFLYNFTAHERASILPTTLTVQTGTNISTKIVANVFLPSTWEILGTGVVSDGSSRFTYFVSKGGASPLTDQAFNNTSASIKPEKVTNNWDFFTRSTSGEFCCTILAANVYTRTPYSGYYGIRPVVNLSASAKISDTTDSDDCYTLVVNNAPTISGSNTDLGVKANAFSTNYTVADADGEGVTVTEYIDNIAIRSYVATLGSASTFSVNGITWLKLTNGIHTLKIVATDGFDTTTRVLTFTKSVTKLVVKRNVPIAASTMPSKIIVTLVKNVPTNALIKVEVCNNGFDSNPTWETINDSSVSSGLVHDFTNTTKTASQWGVNIRVTVDRNGAEGACYITEIGGNFE